MLLTFFVRLSNFIDNTFQTKKITVFGKIANHLLEKEMQKKGIF